MFSLLLKDPFFRLVRGRCFCLELAKLLPVHRYSVDIFFQVLVLSDFWVLTESRILLKLVLKGVRIVKLSFTSHYRLNQTESAFFLYFRFCLFLNDPFSRLFRSKLNVSGFS